MAAESKLQSKICKDIQKSGWIVIKIMLCSKPGIPDLIFLKDKKCIFVEVKSPGEKPEPLQEYWHRRLRDKGFEVYVIDTWEVYLSIKQARSL